MEDGSESGLRLVRPWRLIVAHDRTAATCDMLLRGLDAALGSVELTEASSVDDARIETSSTHFDVALVCLDLPPAPLGGVRLAEELVLHEVPVVLVTRSLRWIPPGALALRDLPWVAPDAELQDVGHAVREAVTSALERRRGARPAHARSALITSRGR